MSVSRRHLVAAGAAAVASPALTRANAPRRWRMVTSWTKNLIGPGVTASRLAKRITEMSDGALEIQVFGAGEVVPALAVFDAVASNSVEMGHTAALFSGGKIPAAPIFTTVPFGLSPIGHASWLDAEGQGLWDRLYAPYGVKPLLGGNTGSSSAGWFRKPVEALADIAGLRIRVTGIGGELYRRLGATPMTLSPGETFPALERGAIDAAEFLAPANDAALGLHRAAPFLAFPGFNKPNGASELLIGKALWEGLAPSLQRIIETAARAEHDLGLAEAHRINGAALRDLIGQGVQVRRLPETLLARAAEHARDILSDIAARDAQSEAIVTRYRVAASDSARAWERLTRT